MSIEERVRAATRARTDLVRDIRSLELPDDLPQRARRPRLARRWGGWLIPLAAAVAVIAVAATLVVVRSLPGASPAPATGTSVTPGPWPPASVNGVPGYYVKIGSGGFRDPGLIVGDAFTGKVLATVAQPANARFAIVGGAGDGRTFIVDAETRGEHTNELWYLLRLAPGTAHPVRLTRLPIDPDFDAMILGLALSPDGRTLAVLDLPNGLSPLLHPDPNSPQWAHRVKVGALTLRTYTVATGKLLHTWTRPWSGLALPGNQNFAGLQWLADGRTLAFEYPLGTTGNFTAKSSLSILTLDTTRPGTNLTGDARVVFHTPANYGCLPTAGMLSPDGRTFACAGSPGATPVGVDPHPACKPESVTITAYSTATGQREHLLYQQSVPCDMSAGGSIDWAGPGGAVIVMIDVTPATGVQTPATFAVLSPGKRTPLKVGVSLPWSGTIAF